MPNYCENFIEISCEEEGQIDAILAGIGGDGVFDFNTLIPYPTKFAELDRIATEYEKEHGYRGRPTDGFNQGGYEWCNANWGTKWNAGRPKIESRSAWSAVIKFDTAWAPPDPIIKALAMKYPTAEIRHEWYERGAEFCGSAFYAEGQLKEKVEADYVGFRGG